MDETLLSVNTGNEKEDSDDSGGSAVALASLLSYAINFDCCVFAGYQNRQLSGGF